MNYGYSAYETAPDAENRIEVDTILFFCVGNMKACARTKSATDKIAPMRMC